MLFYKRSIREVAEAQKGKVMLMNKMDTIKNKLGAELVWEFVLKHMDKKILDEIRFDLSLQEIYNLYCFLHKEKYGDAFYLEKLVRNKNGACIEYDSIVEDMNPRYWLLIDALSEVLNVQPTCQQRYDIYCICHFIMEKEDFYTENIEPSWWEMENVEFLQKR